METFDLFIAGLSAIGLCAATGGACHWWYGRRLTAMADRLDKMDKARQFSQQQTLQARKQIEKLQKDLAAPRGAAHPDSATRPRAPDDATRAQAAMAAALAAGDQRSQVPVHGFADTEPAAQGFAQTQTLPRHGFAPTQAAMPRHGFADTQAAPRTRAY